MPSVPSSPTRLARTDASTTIPVDRQVLHRLLKIDAGTAAYGDPSEHLVHERAQQGGAAHWPVLPQQLTVPVGPSARPSTSNSDCSHAGGTARGCLRASQSRWGSATESSADCRHDRAAPRSTCHLGLARRRTRAPIEALRHHGFWPCSYQQWARGSIPLWELESDSGSKHTLSLTADHTRVDVLDTGFDPASFVMWTPPAGTFLERRGVPTTSTASVPPEVLRDSWEPTKPNKVRRFTVSKRLTRAEVEGRAVGSRMRPC